MKDWPDVPAMEKLPWAARGALGLAAAIVAVSITYAIIPLRAFPLLLAFPTVVLAAWFLGMWGGVTCAFAEAILVDQFLTQSQLRVSIGNTREGVRLAVFLTISILLGWAIRRLAQQRAVLTMHELRQHLSLARAERELAEERVRASETLRDRESVLQVAPQANSMGLWVWDFEPDKVQWSDEVFRVLGREPRSIEPAIDTWMAAVHPDDADGVSAALARVRAGQLDYFIQHRVLWPDGTVRWVEARGKGQTGDGRAVARMVGVVGDVTHRKLAEDAMLRAEKLAIAGRLAASVAHEINNPLEAVSNLLFLISIGEASDSTRQLAKDALDQLMRVSLITQQTLKFHRQTGAPRLATLSEILNSVLSLFHTKLMAAGIKVELKAEREAEVSCMPNEAQQIFANLISNAIDAMPRKGRLDIRLRPSRNWADRKTEGMRITFRDSGVGMDRATMRRIFEPFFTTKTETGTGLGMWVVAQLVERHNGDVRVWSTQRHGRCGTTFSVFLPFRQNGTKAASAEKPSPAEVIVPSDGSLV